LSLRMLINLTYKIPKKKIARVIDEVWTFPFY